jgi:hypothetical protein
MTPIATTSPTPPRVRAASCPIAALLLILAAATELKWANAEGKSLESIADPLSS